VKTHPSEAADNRGTTISAERQTAKTDILGKRHPASGFNFVFNLINPS
jgi:hypothetical protein